MPLKPCPMNTPAAGSRVARARKNWLVEAAVEIEVEFPDLEVSLALADIYRAAGLGDT